MIMLLCSLCIFFLMIRRPPRSTLFPLHDALPISIVVEGVDRLHGVAETILPDRLEAGTFAIGAVITGGEVTLLNVRESDMLPLTSKLLEAGAEVWANEEQMLVRPGKRLKAVEVQTLAFPGFPTDLQAAFAVLMTQAEGT